MSTTSTAGCGCGDTAEQLSALADREQRRVLMIVLAINVALFVGEWPGAEEDARGAPFVAQAGKLLDSMLAALGMRRDANVYIANVVKCRPPNNRTPEPAEAEACRPYLERQIALIRPKLIVALGKSAASLLLGTDATIASLRGRRHRYGETPLVVTYHPAYLLRNLPDKAKAWEDLVFARSMASSVASADPPVA